MTELSDTYVLKIGEKEVVIVMYSGLLRKLIAASKMLTEPDSFLLDVEVQEKFIDLLLTEYDEHGKEKGKLADAFTLPADVCEDLMVWGYNHCLNFTVNTSTKLKDLMEKTAQKLEKVSPPTVAG